MALKGQASRLLRTEWSDAQSLAEELYAMLGSDEDQVIPSQNGVSNNSYVIEAVQSLAGEPGPIDGGGGFSFDLPDVTQDNISIPELQIPEFQIPNFDIPDLIVNDSGAGQTNIDLDNLLQRLEEAFSSQSDEIDSLRDQILEYMKRLAERDQQQENEDDSEKRDQQSIDDRQDQQLNELDRRVSDLENKTEEGGGSGSVTAYRGVVEVSGTEIVQCRLYGDGDMNEEIVEVLLPMVKPSSPDVPVGTVVFPVLQIGENFYGTVPVWM
jgi:hypothetical protein